MGAVPGSERHPLRLAAVAAGGLVLILAAAAAIVALWLRSYAPLSAVGSFAPGPGLRDDAEPVTGSGGRTVFIPAYRPGRLFDTAFTLHNTGRFAVEVTGLAKRSGIPELRPVGLLASDSSTASADPHHLAAFKRLRLDHGDTAIVVVRWRLECGKRSGDVFVDAVPLRYDYLSVFTRTALVELPFAVTLRCSG